MLTDDNNEVQFVSKNQLTNLFRCSEVYHRRKLREMFRKYYMPFRSDHRWTRDLPEQVISDLRLHLSWDLKIRVFDLNRRQIGTRIVSRYKELGTYVFLRHVIINDCN